MQKTMKFHCALYHVSFENVSSGGHKQQTHLSHFTFGIKGFKLFDCGNLDSVTNVYIVAWSHYFRELVMTPANYHDTKNWFNGALEMMI